MTDEQLAYLPATELLELFKRRELSPVEVLEAQISRAERVEPKINAFTDTYFEQALDQARKAEGRPFLTINPEFGPIDPASEDPLADIWDVCLWMTERFRTRHSA